MVKRNRVYPQKLIYIVDSDVTASTSYYRSHSKIFSHTKILGIILRLFGFFPFVQNTDNASGGQLNLKSSVYWLAYSFIILTFQIMNLTYTACSYVFYDSEAWVGLVPVVWLLTPYIFFWQSLLYQILMLFYRQRLPYFYSGMESVFRSLKITPSSEIKFHNIAAVVLALFLPLAAYFSTCTIIKESTYRNSSLATKNCLVWYGYLFARNGNGDLWYVVIAIQFFAFYQAIISSVFVEQWLLFGAKYITNVFEIHLQNLDVMMMANEFVGVDSIEKWINKFSEAYTLSEEFAFMTSSILFVSVITNPILFCLQAFWIAKSFDYKMFKAWGCLVFPTFILLSSFVRFSAIGLYGQRFKDSVSFSFFFNFNDMQNKI